MGVEFSDAAEVEGVHVVHLEHMVHLWAIREASAGCFEVGHYTLGGILEPRKLVLFLVILCSFLCVNHENLTPQKAVKFS